MDSATVLAIARRELSELHTLSIGYGQRHARELMAAHRLARHFRVKREVVVELPVASLLRSSLTDRSRRIPSGRRRRSGIPSTYVPARNTIFLSIALGYAESHRLERIYLGVNAVDYSGYPDCRPEFLRAFNRLAALATRSGVEGQGRIRVLAPLLRLSKSQIVQRGEALGVPWAMTWSCYRGGRRPCARCDSCLLREAGFRDAGAVDPLVTM
ncbi:MAG: 7-cyano-7-deazaguanine synthase QueC [Thermoplasmata archaeon]|nr:7-cyano-7-deazaguanine synthase QueC [Thermoplasmata archaeon]